MQSQLDHYQQLFRRLPMMGAAIDENGYFLDFSDVFLQRLGYSRDELTGLRPVDIATPETAHRIETELIPQMRRAGEVHDMHVSFIAKPVTWST